MKIKFITSISFLFITLNVTATSHDPNSHLNLNDLNHELCQQKMTETLNEQTDDEITVKVTRNEDFTCQRLDISNKNNVLFQDALIGGHFYLGPDAEHGEPFLALTGLGSKNLVISTWNGGAHCCYTLRIFNVSDTFQEILFLESGNFMPTFTDLNGDGIFEIYIKDDFLAYRFSAFAQSATADVILKFDGEKYVVAPEYMLRPPIDLDTLQSEIAVWRAEILESGDVEHLPYTFMKTITDLFFTGHRDTALELINLTWPSALPSKSDFINEYEQALSESKFYADFHAMLE